MAIHDKYYTGSTVSRDLPTGERSFSQVVYQSGKPVLDAELNHDQDIKQEIQKLLGEVHTPSGFFKYQTRRDNEALDYEFVNDTNCFFLNKVQALVAGFPITVEYTNTDTDGKNKIILDPPSVYDGTPPSFKRTDFVFLEVWQSLVSRTPSASGTLQVIDFAQIQNGDTIVIVDPSTAVTETFTATNGVAGVGEFQFTGDEITTATNLATKIDAESTLCSAFNHSTDTITIVSLKAGVVGNSYTLTSSNAAAIVASGATLSGGGPDATNKPTQNHIYRHGNTDSSSNVAVPDDLQDPVLNTESGKRVQVQYRIRVTNNAIGVNFKTEANGFTNANLYAQGNGASPVVGYRFVPADGSTVDVNSSAVAYDKIDNGLFIAGDGSSTAATDLGTVDGFVYAIPICFIFRKNDAWDSGNGNGFDPQNNASGGLLSTHNGFTNSNLGDQPVGGQIPSGVSDRPDGCFPDIIVRNDLLDLRRHISPNGVDLAAELQYQMKCLLDGNLRTWAIDSEDKNSLGGGSGDVSARHLVCNEVGRSQSHGGQPALSGSTGRGDLIRNFDHVARRFGDQPVVERAVWWFLPALSQGIDVGRYTEQISAGAKNWVEGDRLHLDLRSLNATRLGNWDPNTESYAGPNGNDASVTDFAPPAMTITDILVCTHDDGNYTSAIDQKVEIKTIEGLGTDYVIITLDRNDRMANGGMSDPNPINGNPNPDYPLVREITVNPEIGSARRIFVEYEITYPAGFGLTDTPDEVLSPDSTVYPYASVTENSYSLGGNQRPMDTEGLLPIKFREGFREVMIEYKANEVTGSTPTGKFLGTPIDEDYVSRDAMSLVGWRRFCNDANTTVTDIHNGSVKSTDMTGSEFGSSTRLLKIDPTAPAGALSGAGQTRVEVKYFAQDAVPNYGAAGYQICVYYRSNAPQTCGVVAGDIHNGGNGLPTTLTVTPLVMSHELWSGTVGMGSVEQPYPYVAPLDQIAIKDDGHGSEVKEWYFMATAQVTIDDFNAETGLLNLHTFVPADGTGDMSFNLGATHTTQVDGEFRAYYKLSDPNSYKPTAFTQNFSGVVRHKCFLPFLAKATDDTRLFRKGEVLLMVISRWAELDAQNNVVFSADDNRTCVAVYRTKNLLILAGD